MTPVASGDVGTHPREATDRVPKGLKSAATDARPTSAGSPEYHHHSDPRLLQAFAATLVQDPHKTCRLLYVTVEAACVSTSVR